MSYEQKRETRLYQERKQNRQVCFIAQKQNLKQGKAKSEHDEVLESSRHPETESDQHTASSKTRLEKLKRFVKALKDDASSEFCDLGGFQIGDFGCNEISKSLARNITCSKLSLSDNMISEEGIRSLSTALRTNLRLTSLDISQNNIGPKGLSVLAEGLLHNEALQYLNVSKADLTSHRNDRSITITGITAFANCLRENRTLTSIDISYNCLTDFGEDETALAELLDAVNLNSNIMKLNLSGNELGDSGMQMISKFLQGNNSITHLTLCDNRIQSNGCLAIAELLRQSSNLHFLDLRGNDLSNGGSTLEGLSKLALALENQNPRDKMHRKNIGNNSSLWTLDIRDNYLPESFLEELVHSLRYNSILSALLLDQKPDQDRLYTKLKKLVNANERVQRLLGSSSSNCLEYDEGFTTLHLAVSAGSILSTVCLLQKFGTRIDFLNARSLDEKYTALQIAVKNKDAALITLLLEFGAEVNTVDRNGNSPLHNAAEHMDLALACLLVEKGASLTVVNRNGKIPTSCASLQTFRNEVLKYSSRTEVLILSAEGMERNFAKVLARAISKKKKQLSCFVIDELTTHETFWEKVEICSSVILIFGTFSCSCKKNELFYDRVEFLLKNYAELLLCVLHDKLNISTLPTAFQKVLSLTPGLDMTEWAKNEQKNKEQIEDDKRFRIGNGTEKIASDEYLKSKGHPFNYRRRFFPEDSISIDNLDTLILRITSYEERRHNSCCDRYASKIGSKGDLFRLESIMQCESKFTLIADVTGDLIGISRQIEAELDKRMMKSWCFTKGCVESPESKEIISNAVSKCACFITILPVNWLAVNSQKLEWLEFLYKDVMESSCEALTVLVISEDSNAHPHGKLLNSIYHHILGTTSAIAFQLRDNSKQGIGTGSLFPQDEMENVLLREGVGYGSGVGAIIHNVNRVYYDKRDSSEDEFRIAHLEAKLKKCEKDLKNSRKLNNELFSCMKKYDKRWREACRVSDFQPEKQASRYLKELQTLQQETNRVLALKSNYISTPLLPNTLKQPLDKKSVIQLLDKKIRGAKENIAANNIQRIWRGLVARDRSERKRLHVKAKVIQKAFRGYRFRLLAWRYL